MYCSPMLSGMSSYEIRDFRVYFGNQYLPDAEWSNFKDLGQGYGKDIHHVFFMGQILIKAEPYSFQVLNDGYAKDYQHVFHYGHIIEDLQPHCSQASINSNNESIHPDYMETANLSMISTQIPSYDIHDFKVFFGNQYIPEARWIDFTDLGHGYGKDVHQVFYMGHIIREAHSFSFEVLNKNYAKDKNYVFYNGQIVQGLQPIGFQVPPNRTIH